MQSHPLISCTTFCISIGLTSFSPNPQYTFRSVPHNYSKLDTRRIEWNFGVDYGEDYNKVEKVLREIIANDKRILTSPAPFIELGELAASSVNIKIRVWVNSSDYWNVFFSMNQTVYTTFNKEGINFPFPQLTVHQA